MISVLAVSAGSVFKMSGVCFKITRLMTYKGLFSTFELNIPDKILANATFTSPVCFCYMIKQLWDQIKSWFFFRYSDQPIKMMPFPNFFLRSLNIFSFSEKNIVCTYYEIKVYKVYHLSINDNQIWKLYYCNKCWIHLVDHCILIHQCYSKTW